MGFCPSGVLSDGVLSEWGVMSSGVLSVYRNFGVISL